MAALQFSPEDAALILGLPADVFRQLIDVPDSAAYMAWHRGRLKASADVRHAILVMAKQGSSPAQRDFLAMAAAPVATPTDGPILSATRAHLADLLAGAPDLAGSPLVPLAERLARQLDDGGGSQTANLARELRTTLAELGAREEPDDDDDDVGAMSAALLDPEEP